jgi:hypothetical protein
MSKGFFLLLAFTASYAAPQKQQSVLLFLWRGWR